MKLPKSFRTGKNLDSKINELIVKESIKIDGKVCDLIFEKGYGYLKDTENEHSISQIYSIDKEHSEALGIVNKYLEADSTSKEFQEHKVVLEKMLENEEKFSIGNK